MADRGNLPERRFRSGRVSAAVWINEAPANGENTSRYAISLSKGYRNREGQWRRSRTFFPEDIPHIQTVTSQVLEFVNAQAG